MSGPGFHGSCARTEMRPGRRRHHPRAARSAVLFTVLRYPRRRRMIGLAALRLRVLFGVRSMSARSAGADPPAAGRRCSRHAVASVSTSARLDERWRIGSVVDRLLVPSAGGRRHRPIPAGPAAGGGHLLVLAMPHSVAPPRPTTNCPSRMNCRLQPVESPTSSRSSRSIRTRIEAGSASAADERCFEVQCRRSQGAVQSATAVSNWMPGTAAAVCAYDRMPVRAKASTKSAPVSPRPGRRDGDAEARIAGG